MASSAAEIGANFSDYHGDAGLAGGNFGVIDANTKPLDQLAAYTMLSNQVKWKQQQIATDAKVQELSKLSDISLNDLRGKDKEQASKEFSDLINYASEYARKQPKNNQERLKNELEWQTRYGAFKNNFNSGKGRAVSYYAHLNTIKQNITDATTQDKEIEILNRTFDNTGIDTPISAVPNFKMEKFDLPNPIVTDISKIDVEGNDTFTTKGGVWVGGKNAPIADAAILDLSKVNIKKGSPEYDLLTQNEKDQADLQATVQTSGKGWLDAVTPLNESLKAHIRPDGTFDATKFEEDNASNTTLMNAYNGLKRMSEYSKQKKDEAIAGIFNDSGVQAKLPQSIVPNDFNAGIIDFANGVNTTQLVMAGSLAKYEGDKFTKTVQHTGEANDLLKARMIQQGENYRAGLADARAMYPYLYAKKGTDKQTEEDIVNVNSVLSEVSSIINGGAASGTNTSITDKFFGGKESPFQISDPTILKEFATINKDGKTTVQPDLVKYDKKKDELILIYNKVDEEGKALEPEMQRLNAQTYLNMKVKQKFPNKDIGAINAIISKIFNKEGNLFKIAQSYNKSEPQNNQPEPVNNNGGMTDEQYNEFLKKNGLK